MNLDHARFRMPMGGKAQMRCLALRPSATDSQAEFALNLGPALLVDVGHATAFVACRNAAILTAGVRNSAPTPYLWAAALQPQHCVSNA